MGVGSSSLQELARNGEDEKLSRKLQAGADVNKPGPRSQVNRRPLHVAVRAGKLSSVFVLLNHGAKVNCSDDTGETALHYAASSGNVAIARVLLNYGADHTVRNKEGCMPIHVAIANRHEKVRELLCSHALENPVEFRYYDQSCWYDFDARVSKVLAFELGEGVNFTTLVVENGPTFIIDFVQQLRINIATLYSQSIAWKAGLNGEWHYPSRPFEGVHLGAEDPRYIAQYGLTIDDAQVRHLRSSRRSSERRVVPNETDMATPVRMECVAGLGSCASSMDRPLDWRELQDIPATRPPDPECCSPVIVRFAEYPAKFELLQRGEEYFDIVLRFLRGMDKEAAKRSSSSSSPVTMTRGGFHERGMSIGSLPREVSSRYRSAKAKSRRGMSMSGLQEPAVMRPPPKKHAVVTAVHRVHLPEARQNAFEMYRADRAKARGGNANVRWGWHGAPLESLLNIILNGFSLRAKERNGKLYGHGIYLAPENHAFSSAEFAEPDEAGEKHLLFAKVIIGSMEVIPFESAQFQPSLPDFDTGVDNKQDPTRYIVTLSATL
ncbi:hypothetical protein CBR_g16983 [Chara braunii]|uniref:Poly [ADP-ribose] polymerase n=1 Tax=Chara braunii TaxID=69332 RepID=A0A388KUA0_CHABU|nr:hypothetical protein CBR_g16983 [Chara braunii]|eukprot:GBG73640.1 hypothetical protein CBR_g16983 [Chara braunii]